MIRDLKTMFWKERKSLFNQRGGKRQAILTLLVPAGMFAIVLPWQQGRDFFESPLPIFASIFIPMLIVLLILPESFAGERERHTLETLLASRLSDRVILFGKLIVPVTLGWIITIVALFIGFIIANITDWSGQLIFYTTFNLLTVLVLSFLIAVTSASVGVLISLRAATVREAQQTLMATIMFPVLLLGVAGTFVLTMEIIRDRVTQFMDTIEPTVLFLIVTIILIAVCYLFMRVAFRRFNRSRLILS